MVIKKNKKTLKMSKYLKSKKSKKSKKMRGGGNPPKNKPVGTTGPVKRVRPGDTTGPVKRVRPVGNTPKNPGYTHKNIVGIANEKKTPPKVNVTISAETKLAFAEAIKKFGESPSQPVEQQKQIKPLTPSITTRVAEAVKQFSAQNAKIAPKQYNSHLDPNIGEKTEESIKSLTSNGGLHSNHQGKIYETASSSPKYPTASKNPNNFDGVSNPLYNFAKSTRSKNLPLSPHITSGYMEINPITYSIKKNQAREEEYKKYSNELDNIVEEDMRKFAVERAKKRAQKQLQNYEPYYAKVGPTNIYENMTTATNPPYYSTIPEKEEHTYAQISNLDLGSGYKKVSNVKSPETSYYSTIPESEEAIYAIPNNKREAKKTGLNSEIQKKSHYVNMSGANPDKATQKNLSPPTYVINSKGYAHSTLPSSSNTHTYTTLLPRKSTPTNLGLSKIDNKHTERIQQMQKRINNLQPHSQLQYDLSQYKKTKATLIEDLQLYKEEFNSDPNFIPGQSSVGH